MWTSARTDRGDLRVSSAAALEGIYGLEAVIDDNRAIYVVDETPAGLTSYRARFLFDPNTTSIRGGKADVIFVARRSTGLVAFQIEVRRVGRDYQVRTVAPQAGGPSFTTPWSTLTDDPHLLEAAWSSATSPRARDGSLVFFVDDRPAGGTSSLRNFGRTVDSVRLGAVNGVDARTRGMMYFDSFESWAGE